VSCVHVSLSSAINLPAFHVDFLTFTLNNQLSAMMFVSESLWIAMIRSVVRTSWFLAFRVLVLTQWSALVSAFSQTSTLFSVYGTGQTPVAGMELLVKLTVGSVFECGRFCWNNGDNAGCEGFLYQTQPCDLKGSCIKHNHVMETVNRQVSRPGVSCYTSSTSTFCRSNQQTSPVQCSFMSQPQQQVR
jgi:hypothetical protein